MKLVVYKKGETDYVPMNEKEDVIDHMSATLLFYDKVKRSLKEIYVHDVTFTTFFVKDCKKIIAIRDDLIGVVRKPLSFNDIISF